MEIELLTSETGAAAESGFSLLRLAGGGGGSMGTPIGCRNTEE